MNFKSPEQRDLFLADVPPLSDIPADRNISKRLEEQRQEQVALIRKTFANKCFRCGEHFSATCALCRSFGDIIMPKAKPSYIATLIREYNIFEDAT